MLALSPLTTPTSDATVGVDDYPSRLKSAAQDSLVDPWNFYNRECTSFVAWRLNNDAGVGFHNYYLGVHWGNASNWRYAANQVGVPVDDTPQVGAVAWWAAGSPGSSRGHVAWVRARTAGSITIEEYNYLSAGHYDQRTISTSSSSWPSAFIHIGRTSLNNIHAPSVGAGSPKVAKKLMARPGSWSLSGATFSYQWLADGAAISDATNRTFAPRPAQLGKQLQVRVTARYGSLKPVTATSPASRPVGLGQYVSTQRPTVSGIAQVGEPLTATRGRWAPNGATFAYQWLADGKPVDGATSRRFAPRAEQLGQQIQVKVSTSGDAMKSASAFSNRTEAVIPGVLLVNDEPTITGTPQVDNQLSATRGTWSAHANWTYQWTADGQPVRGAVSSTFAPSAEQLGQRLQVRVKASRPGYRTAFTQSTVTNAVVPATFAKTGPPTISGTPQVDKPLTASAGVWSPSGRATFQWYVGGKAVTGATTTSFTPRVEDVRKQITVKVTMRRDGYVTTSSVSDASPAVVPGTFHNTSDPTLTGTARVGLTLTAHPGDWSPTPTLSYQWYADGVAIPGATGTTFTATAAELDKHITVQVTARRPGYLTALVESAPTSRVQPGTITSVERPDISGHPYVGNTLTATDGRWSVHPTSVGYQWYADGHAIAGATASTFKPTTAELDAVITVRVTVSTDGYDPAGKTSEATTPVVHGRVEFTRDPSVSGTAVVGKVLTADPGRYTPSTAKPSYTWLRGGEAISGATGAKYRLVPADVGRRITVRVTLSAAHWEGRSAKTPGTPVVRAVPELTVRNIGSGHKVVLALNVHSPGISDPHGTAIVTDRGVQVGRITVTDGRGRLVLTGVADGVHRYRIEYTGLLQVPRHVRLDVTIG
jgi:surface antigen